jgi:hypothetical protein
MISSSLLVLVGQPASVCWLVGGIDHRQNQEAHRHLDLTMLSRDVGLGAEGFEEPQPGHEEPVRSDEGDGPRGGINYYEVSASGHRRNCTRCSSASAIVDTKWTQSVGSGLIEAAK